MHRFFVDKKIEVTVIIDEEEQVKQMQRVLRLTSGARVWLFNNTGKEYDCEIVEIDNRKVFVSVVEERAGLGFSRKINLYQALLKKDNFELVTQKATELGVQKIVPIECQNCVQKEFSEQKYERLHKVIIEAVEQSEGSLIPALNQAVSFTEAVKSLNKNSLNLIAYERDPQKSLEGLDLDNEINLFIGPEGGFTPEEIKIAQENGIISVSLGKRILRAETAAIAALGRLIID